MKQVSRGFTLMELMVVLAIAAVILGIGAPSFNRFLVNNRMTNTANDALVVITKARTEAIKRQANVSICASANPLDSNPTCTDGATAGLILFVDTANNCTRVAGTPANLLGSAAYDNSITTNQLVVKMDGNCISYAATGFRNNVAGKTMIQRIIYCDNRGKNAADGTTQSAARGIIISRTGRAKITRDRTTGLSEDVTSWTGALACP